MKEFAWLEECKDKKDEELAIAAYPEDYDELDRWKTPTFVWRSPLPRWFGLRARSMSPSIC